MSQEALHSPLFKICCTVHSLWILMKSPEYNFYQFFLYLFLFYSESGMTSNHNTAKVCVHILARTLRLFLCKLYDNKRAFTSWVWHYYGVHSGNLQFHPSKLNKQNKVRHIAISLHQIKIMGIHFHHVLKPHTLLDGMSISTLYWHICQDLHFISLICQGFI